jgi:hypothetical protein
MPKMHEDDVIEGAIPEIVQPKSPPLGATNATATNLPTGGDSTFGSAPTGFGAPTGGFGAPATTSGFGNTPLGGNSASGFSGGSSFGASTNSFGTTPGVNTQQINQGQMNSTAGGSNAAQGADVLVANTNEDWINKKWRPVMGWVYMLTCTADFVIFPILWSLLQAMSHGQVTSQWQPLTLQGAGLYHIAMGAVLGIAAYGRTKEKLESKQ